MSSAGDWKIVPWRGGYPVWCEIHFDGRQIAKIRHTDLRDLEYAVKRAILEAREILPDTHKHEMD